MLKFLDNVYFDSLKFVSPYSFKAPALYLIGTVPWTLGSRVRPEVNIYDDVN